MAELARLFLRLGVLGFGGPAAHVAMMRAEVVRRRGWMDDPAFLDLVGATSLIPGPNSTELAIWLGQRRAGGRGLLVAGVCFIVPAAAIVLVLAELYVRGGDAPALDSLRFGVLPVVVAIVAHATVGLGRTALRTPALVLVALLALALRLVGLDELAVLGLGLAGAGVAALGPQLGRSAAVVAPVLAVADGVALDRLFLVFLRFGSVVFGSGYVLLAFLEGTLVDDLGWLTRLEVLDAVAVGQVTPGPVFTTATFVGYLLRGLPGAGLATLGIFLPSFVLVALLSPVLPRVLARPWARPALDVVNATALGLLAAVAADLAAEVLDDGWAVLLATAALVALLRTRLDVTWLVTAGAAVGGLHALT